MSAATLAAIASAIAAFFAGLSSFLTMRIHRRNALQNVRPEPVLLGWSRSDAHPNRTTLRVRAVKNVGCGTAFSIGLEPIPSFAPHVQSSWTGHFAWLLAPGEEQEIDYEAEALWDNVQPDQDGGKTFQLKLVLSFSDLHGRIYKTTHSVYVLKELMPMGPGQVPGVHVSFRWTADRSRAEQVLHSWLRKLRIIRSAIEDDLVV